MLSKILTEGQKLHDSTYMQSPKQSHSQNQRGGEWLSGTESRGKWRVAVNGYKVIHDE